MAIQYGILTIENRNTIIEKAKTKSNGCYKMRGIAYRVRDGKVTHFACNGEVLEAFGAFNVVLGSCHWSSDAALKALKGL